MPLMVLASSSLAGSNLLRAKAEISRVCVTEGHGALSKSVPGSPWSRGWVPCWKMLSELTLPLSLGMLKLSPLGA